MSIGAKDQIDQMLVRKYSEKRMDNAEDSQIMAMSAEQYWKTAKELAELQRGMVQVCAYLKKKKDEANKKYLINSNKAIS